jgi:hypothetical protein
VYTASHDTKKIKELAEKYFPKEACKDALEDLSGK